MHVPVAGAECDGQGVVVGEVVAAVAADEAHRRPAVALTGEVQEVADDHAEVVQVPVQRLDVLGALQHDVSEPLHACGQPRRPLGCVGAQQFMADVEDVSPLRGERGQVVRARDDADRDPARVDEVDRQPADALGQRPGGGAHGIGQAQHVDLVLRGERHPGELRAWAASHHHARGGGVGAAQLKFVGRPQQRREAEGLGECLGAPEVGLLELQPGDVGAP